jgi:DNA-binding transcriptional LysR family regulator
MDLDGVAIFVKVIQAGSFSLAAKLLGMPNSTVSAKVAALEKRLGVTLLQRTTRSLRPTQVGEAYFQRAVRALNDLQTAENELENNRTEPTGLLRLTAPTDVGHDIVPALVQRYLDAHSSMAVELVITNRMVDLVREAVDLAIRAGELKDSGLIAKRYELGYFGLWASPDYLARRGKVRHPKRVGQRQLPAIFAIRHWRDPAERRKRNRSPNFEWPCAGRRFRNDPGTCRARRRDCFFAELSLRQRKTGREAPPRAAAMARREGFAVASLSGAKIRSGESARVYRGRRRDIEEEVIASEIYAWGHAQRRWIPKKKGVPV